MSSSKIAFRPWFNASDQEQTRILVATDFSEPAKNALRYAVQLAEDMNADINLIHVGHVGQQYHDRISEPFAELLSAGKLQEAFPFFESYVSQLLDEFESDIELDLTLSSGPSATGIIQESDDTDTALIIIGAQGVNMFSKQGIGSVALEVLDQAHCPVLAVPIDAKYEPINHMMYATEFSQEDFSIIDQLLEFASQFNAKLSCTHVRDEKAHWEEAELSLFEKKYQDEHSDRMIDFFISTHENVVHGLYEFVTEYKVDLIALLHHHRYANGHSVTKQMSMYTDIPMLVFGTDSMRAESALDAPSAS
ncbi:universal stress protein [Pontibacter sp. G13]|uniref:universal stress protein n=1 Tax=Pontibacter sp. G13 TaxID=3074898 RepID=UPI0028896D08|nr:universal stress protein [Pontibacter sp. G13]WNJ20792.1 universal stress protein [Pontibacter sp. G13]